MAKVMIGPKGPMKPMGELCNGSVGGRIQKGINPDALPRSGRHGADMDYDEIDGRPVGGLPMGPPRSGYHGGK